MTPSAPNALSRRFLPALLAVAFLGTLGLQLVSARRHAHALELLRLENSLLDQEVRLLRQQLEAERILAAAQTRPAPTSPHPTGRE